MPLLSLDDLLRFVNEQTDIEARWVKDNCPHYETDDGDFIDPDDIYLKYCPDCEKRCAFVYFEDLGEFLDSPEGKQAFMELQTTPPCQRFD